MAGFIREFAYQRLLDSLSAWARVLYRSDLGAVERFVLFVGYPRSGHSIVGAMLNAHRDAVISHELNVGRLVLQGCSREEAFARILARAYWFDLRGNRTNYSYEIPGQWQGRFDSLRVIGDKRAGSVTRYIEANPDFLDRVRALVEVPLRLIHVVRNPYDNIAAISIWHALSLEEAADFYFSHCRTVAALPELADPSQAITIRHEDMVSDPETALAAACSFLGLELYEGYLEDCCRVVFDVPTNTRQKVAWSAALLRNIARRARSFPFFEGYEFEPRAA